MIFSIIKICTQCLNPRLAHLTMFAYKSPNELTLTILVINKNVVHNVLILDFKKLTLSFPFRLRRAQAEVLWVLVRLL